MNNIIKKEINDQTWNNDIANDVWNHAHEQLDYKIKDQVKEQIYIQIYAYIENQILVQNRTLIKEQLEWGKE